MTAITLTPERIALVDIAYAFMSLGLTYVIPMPRPHQLTVEAVWKPFQPIV